MGNATFQEACEYCRGYDDHSWVYEIDRDGNVVIGGNDRFSSIANARANGYSGPVFHWDRVAKDIDGYYIPHELL